MKVMRIALPIALIIGMVVHAGESNTLSDMVNAQLEVARAKLHDLIDTAKCVIGDLNREQELAQAQAEKYAQDLAGAPSEKQGFITRKMHEARRRAATLKLKIVERRTQAEKEQQAQKIIITELENPQIGKNRQQQLANLRQSQWLQRKWTLKKWGFVLATVGTVWNAWGLYNWSGWEDLQKAWNKSIGNGLVVDEWQLRSNYAGGPNYRGPRVITEPGAVRCFANAMGKITKEGFGRLVLNAVILGGLYKW